MVQKKDTPLIISETQKDWGTELVIKRDNSFSYQGSTRLADVFDFTPSGFIYKDETGMGATTLELMCPRHSIIVEPIRITASSKAFEHSKKSGSEVLYVGSGTQYHPAKSTTKTVIQAYLADPSIKFKKILVVADSLQKVYDIIETEQIKDDFFLLIDEIDSFQIDSKYRHSMEKCMEIYTHFKEDNRAMLSATRIKFSDPLLRAEPITFVKYENPNKRNIDIITTNSKSLMGISADYIELLLNIYPDDKFFIAFNSVAGCLDLAEHLVKQKVIQEKEINIFCSSNSANKVRKYFKELNTDKLPGRLNFFTSAYFSGFDLTESYHLVSISGNKNKIHALSDRRIKQIAGRSRLGLITETIIHDVAISNTNYLPPNVSDLLDAAQTQVDALGCISKHFKKSELMSTFVNDISNSFMTTLDDKSSRYIRQDLNGNYVISYLNIDAEIESIRIREELYQNDYDLTNKLKLAGHTINPISATSTTVVDKLNNSQIDRDNEVNVIVDYLLKFKYGLEITDMLNEDSFQLSNFQKEIANEYHLIIEFVDQVDTLEKIRASLLGLKDTRKFKNLMTSAKFQTYPKGHIFVDRLDHYLPVGKKFTKDDLKNRFKIYLEELKFNSENLSDVSLMKLLNLLRKIYRKRDPNTLIDYEVITNCNPLKLKIIKQKKSYKHDESLFEVIMSYFST